MEQTKERTPANGHVISLRKLSDDLYWRIKERAVHARQGIEEYVVTVLEEATKADADQDADQQVKQKGRSARTT